MASASGGLRNANGTVSGGVAKPTLLYGNGPVLKGLTNAGSVGRDLGMGVVSLLGLVTVGATFLEM